MPECKKTQLNFPHKGEERIEEYIGHIGFGYGKYMAEKVYSTGLFLPLAARATN